MTAVEAMEVVVRLPARVLFEGQAARLTAVGRDGGFGLLPNHVDFLAELVPSVLTLVQPDGRERFFGIDEGLLVKRGGQVSVAVRRGVAGDDLTTLHARVRESFVQVQEEEREARAALSRLEADMVRSLARLNRPQP